jgi:hypothetical protein
MNDYDDDSPANDYVRRLPAVPDRHPVAEYVSGGLALTREAVDTLESQGFIEYIDEGNVSILARALVTGRLETLERRRAMLNTVRSYIGLAPRGVSVERQVRKVTEDLMELYGRARAMIEEKNKYADAVIEYRTKRKQLELAEANLEADIMEAKLRAAKAARELAPKEKRDPQDEMDATRRRAMREEERKHADRAARAEARVQWREETTRKMNAKIQVVSDDPSLSASDKAALIEEIKDEYGQILGRDI